MENENSLWLGTVPFRAEGEPSYWAGRINGPQLKHSLAFKCSHGIPTHITGCMKDTWENALKLHEQEMPSASYPEEPFSAESQSTNGYSAPTHALAPLPSSYSQLIAEWPLAVLLVCLSVVLLCTIAGLLGGQMPDFSEPLLVSDRGTRREKQKSQLFFPQDRERWGGVSWGEMVPG